MSSYNNLDTLFDAPKYAVDDQIFNILRRILMNVWHYSENHSQRVYFYAQKSEENSYGIDVLFKVMDGYYEIHELNHADTDFVFDVSAERQRYLYQIIGEIFGHELLPLLASKSVLPTSISASWSLDGGHVDVSFGYGEIHKTLQGSLTQWKKELIAPENSISFIRMHENGEIL